MSKWIRFVEKEPAAKTRRWVVESLGGVLLGWVSWYSPWRKYAYSVMPQTVYEEECLRDIAQFCEDRTKEYKAARQI